jgi:hypothetical protein
MGTYIADQYSLLHLSVGVIAYFWNFSLLYSFIIHFVFELLENTTIGVSLINKYIIEPGYFSWPGGKHHPDSLLNMLGDNIFFALGWTVAYVLDAIGTKYKWYI